MTYPDFFEKATTHRAYPWQERLALGPECRSRLIDIPTGLGKTAGVVLAWIWNRMQSDENSPWPRRLIYCLPMRTLVEQTESDQWQTIAQHTDDVCDALEPLLGCCGNTLSAPEASALRNAARWHDWGKAHPAFQAKLNGELLEAKNFDGPAAKAPESAWRKGRISKKPVESDDRRPPFRHELASALGVLLPDSGFPLNRDDTDTLSHDLAAYLIAAHHGKVRLSIRSMPDEWIPPKADPDSDTDGRFARGVWDGDALPCVDLGGSTTATPVTLSLEPMELGLGEQDPFRGQPPWAERCLTLRDTLGPFKLAFLETLLRAADGRASAKPKKP